MPLFVAVPVMTPQTRQLSNSKVRQARFAEFRGINLG